jgi:glycyl-tRNA synthetase
MSISDAYAKKIISTKWHAYWLGTVIEWFTSIGMRKENLRIRQHTNDELSHYSSETWDVEYKYSWGWKELMGIANRGNFDLTQHSKFSGKDMALFDEESKEKVIPFVIEPSFGLDRLIFTLLLDAYSEKTEKEEMKTILQLDSSIAPADVAVFPLMKKDGMSEKADALAKELRKSFVVIYDEAGSIGKRYARVDEIGVKWAVTVDYDTLEDGTVTIRDRDTSQQERIKLDEIPVRIRRSTRS